MTDQEKKLVLQFPATAEGKAFYRHMEEELDKLKDVTTVTGGEVELKARQDAIEWVRKTFIHTKSNVDRGSKPSYT